MKILLIFLETAVMTAVRIIQILSFNETGAITASWTTPALWVLTAALVLTSFLPIGGGKDRAEYTGDILSVPSGIAAVVLGIMLPINGVIHYLTFASERFALPTLIVACAASLTLIFIVGAVNVFNKVNIYGDGAMGLPILFVIWLGLSMIGVFFIDKTIRLGHLNAFSILEYSSYLFFFLAYLKDFCGVGEETTRKKTIRFALLSAAFAVPNVATKLAYNFIPTKNIISQSYNFDFSGVLLDFALFAFAVCVAATALVREKSMAKE